MMENAELFLVGANNAPWHWSGYPGWHWAMGGHGLFWLALAALIVVAVVGLTLPTRRALPGTENSANSELDIRYARGEMNQDEYLERKRDLV